ncbi:MAG: hypothetical protein Q9170_003532 [Blastenia crenularia]
MDSRTVNSGRKDSSSAADLDKHPLRAHPNVTEFAAKTAVIAPPIKANEIHPIKSLPADMPEEQFARVRFLGDDYWIVADQDGKNESFSEDFMAINKHGREIAVSTSGDKELQGKRRSCKLMNDMGWQRLMHGTAIAL